ncbi:Peptidase M23 [Desulfarculus baarsii DSM 2075]|uniref:Peptidase M23 n=1 Tax=Desulfarculus baarsii (strain ATCC 33931 / DSM 2075 / LMG 7858 / VKM B-1802 / 2st14) TaxID=644282 RepID=E1QJF3_DESB2|nr:peptidoglycan DD-metalloendopeptidase family protein [Desulfarculus baarsii]ADK85696.1 Peptidase M23 [Desulfarculus baarsii DSM 2075]
MSFGSQLIPASYSAGLDKGLGKEELEKAKLSQACKMFEAYFLKQMMSAMRQTLEGDTLLGGGNAEKIFTDMLDQAYADEAVAGDSGVGLAAMLEKQLGRSLLPHAGSAKQMPGLASAGRQALAAGAQSGQIELDAPLQGAITSTFGTRIHPISGQEQEHTGLDLAAPEGSDIQTAAAGEVIFAGENGGYGNLVIVRHVDGRQTYYAHCQDILVAEGQQVSRGQVIATVGSTGTSTGPHLHFEVRNSVGQPQDPLPTIRAGLNTTA